MLDNIKIDVKLDVNQLFTQLGVPLKNLPFLKMWLEKRKYIIGLIEAQTDHDKQLIREGKAYFCMETGKLIRLESLNAMQLPKAISDIREQNNFDRIVQTVLEELKNKKLEDFDIEKDTEYFNEEFTPYWEKQAYQMNREDLRDFWAKILVQEMQHPHSVSIRTMEFVKTLSQRDAKIFEKILPYVMDNLALPHIYNIIHVLDLEHLEYLGLLLNGKTGNRTEPMSLSKKYKLTFEKIKFKCYFLSDIGKELYAIADVKECDFEKLEEVFDNDPLINVGDKIKYHHRLNEKQYDAEPFQDYEKKVQKGNILLKYDGSLPRLSLEPNI